MSGFRLLTKTRQATEYSCGACALQAVLSYWGKDVDEAELLKLLHTTPEEGTYPEDIVRGARSFGFEADVKVNLTLDEVENFTADGKPMIALGQVWRSESDPSESVLEDWDDGHYIVVLAVDKKYVYFQDPYVRMSKVFVPRQAFEDHWHQVMGGDLTKNPRLMHLGIFVRGQTPAKRKVAAELGLHTLDFEKFGSLNLIVVRFPRVLLPYDFLREVTAELSNELSNGSIRPNAFIFLRKDKDGNLTGLEGSRLSDEDELAANNALIAALTSRTLGTPEIARSKAEDAMRASAQGDFGLSADDIQKIGARIDPEQSAIIVLFENVWERKLKKITKKYGGVVVNQRLISSDALVKAAHKLASGADLPQS